MREFVRPAATALSIACLALAMAILSTGGALAQAKQEPPKQAAPAQAAPPPARTPAIKQIALTDKQIEGVLAAQKDFDAIDDKLPNNARRIKRALAQLDAVAKKNGFANYAEYEIVVDNISLVLAGFDPCDQEICRRGSGDQGPDRAGAGGQEDVGRRQEGSACRTQRGAEVAAARGHDQGQHRSRHQVLRQACRSAWRRRGADGRSR